MSDGNVHFADGIVVGTGLVLACTYFYSPDSTVWLGGVIGAAGGLLITPDSDLEQTTYTERLLRKVPIVGIWIQTKLYPYALLNEHRGRSHWPVFGTLERIGTLVFGFAETFFAIVGVLYYLGYVDYIPTERITIAWPMILNCLLCWIIQDITHILRDHYSSWTKRRFSSKRYGKSYKTTVRSRVSWLPTTQWKRKRY